MDEDDDEVEKLEVKSTGYLVPALPETGQSKDALMLAKEVDGSNFYGGMGKVAGRAKNAKWRIDRQKPPAAGYTNLQIQRNGVDRPSTVACVLVPNKLSDEIQEATEARKDSMIKELGRAINQGFHRSEKSRRRDKSGGYSVTVFKVVGTFSS